MNAVGFGPPAYLSPLASFPPLLRCVPKGES